MNDTNLSIKLFKLFACLYIIIRFSSGDTGLELLKEFHQEDRFIITRIAAVFIKSPPIRCVRATYDKTIRLLPLCTIKCHNFKRQPQIWVQSLKKEDLKNETNPGNIDDPNNEDKPKNVEGPN